MKSILSTLSLRFKHKPECVAAIGVFDGLHKGHTYILDKVIAKAKRLNVKSLLVSFNPHPRIFYKKRFTGYITALEEKSRILEGTSLDYFWCMNFNKRLSSMSAETFINYISRYFNIRKIIVGEDFRFGYKAKSNINDLRIIGKKNDISILIIKKRRLKNLVIKSSLIRSLIKEHNFKSVRELLGRPYFISGLVKKGAAVGRKRLGIPTINLEVDDKVLPPCGVYLSRVRYREKDYAAISNLGRAPTVQKRKTLLETHIFNFKKNIYKDLAKVVFIKMLRKEKKFSSLDKLKKQINKDIKSAKKIFSDHNILYLP